MAPKWLCNIAGHKPDPCGVCRRCGREENSSHQGKEVERERACFRKEACETCGQVREQPEHDWEPGDNGLQCSRCDVTI